MNQTRSALRRFALALPAALPALALPVLALSTPAQAAKAPPPPAIISLPLNPVIPPAQRSCTAVAASGLGHATLKAGAGTKPTASDYVLVNYIGYLAETGAVFDQGMGAAFAVTGVIPGFGEGLTMLQRGGIMRFCIPAALGYGAAGTGPIPANAALVFQVELLDFRSAAEVEAAQRASAAPAVEPPKPAQ